MWLVATILGSTDLDIHRASLLSQSNTDHGPHVI